MPGARKTRIRRAAFSIIGLLLMARYAPAQAQLTIVSAADYTDFPLAPDSLVSIFASNIATGTFVATSQAPAPLPTSLGGVSATITDAAGNTLPIPLIAVTPGQINAVLPNGSQTGPAIVTVTSSIGAKISGNMTLYAVGPSLFTADETGGWLAAAQVVVTHADGSQTFMASVATCGNNLVWNGMTWSDCVPIPISLGSATDEVVLELYGTGIRGVSSVLALCPNCGYVPVTVGGLTVLYAGAQGAGGPGSFYGLDQINVVLPHYLAGSGVIPLMATVLAGYISGEGEGDDSNTVYIDIQ